MAWIGFAGVDGMVRVASGGLLEGADVSARPWFRGGLEGGFAGDIHEGLLLQSLLSPDASDPLRFIDLSLPVTDEAGRRIGVLGMHLDADWLLNYLAESAAIRDLDVFLVQSDGRLAFASTGMDAASGDTATLRAAAIGAPGIHRETWPDGREYVTAVIPEVSYRSLPDYGWRLLGRVAMESALLPTSELIRTSATLALATASLFAIAAVVYSVIFVRPLLQLVDVAERVSLGERVFPPRARSSGEAARLASAITRWQSRHEPGADPKG